MKYLVYVCLIATAFSLSLHGSDSDHPKDYKDYCPQQCKKECTQPESKCTSACLTSCEASKKEEIKIAHCENECKLMEKNWECIQYCIGGIGADASEVTPVFHKKH